MNTLSAERSQERRSERSPARRYVLMALKIAVSLILLTLLFSRIDDKSGLWRSAQQASIGWLIAALGIYLINVLASVWRWKLLLGTQQVDLPQRTLLGSFLVALFFNNFLPSNIGGDVIR